QPLSAEDLQPAAIPVGSAGDSRLAIHRERGLHRLLQYIWIKRPHLQQGLGAIRYTVHHDTTANHSDIAGELAIVVRQCADALHEVAELDDGLGAALMLDAGMGRPAVADGGQTGAPF